MYDETKNSELEGNRNFNWEEYRALVDEHTLGSRKVGLLDQKLAERAIRDPRSVILDTDSGQIPALVPIQYADGYDVDRITQITKEYQKNIDSVYYFCLPPNVLNQSELDQLAQHLRTAMQDDIFVYFDYVEGNEKTKQELEYLLSQLQSEISSVPLFDSRVQEKNRQASLELYVAPALRNEVGKDIVQSERSIYDEFQIAVVKGEFEKYPDNGTTILLGNEIDKSLRKKMWDLYIDRFRDLGEFHPITMEDTYDNFIVLVDNPNNTFSLTFKDSEPVCWTCFTTDLDQMHWLNEHFITNENLGLNANQTILFMPEIVAKKDDVGGYAKPTLQFPVQIAARTSANFVVTFESTNRSAEYIPYMATTYITDTGVFDAEARLVDRTLYACYLVKKLD